jgi:hypothetical protein
LLRDGMERRVAATAAVLHQALRSMGGLEVRDADGTAVSCRTAEEAGQALVRLWDESSNPGGISINWTDGRARFDDRQTWSDISSAILPLLGPPAVRGPAPITRPVETAKNGG